MVQSQLFVSPDIGMPLADEAFDGSGSGGGWSLSGRDRDMDDNDNEDEDNVGDDEDGHEASGSGMGPTTLGINSQTSFIQIIWSRAVLFLAY